MIIEIYSRNKTFAIDHVHLKGAHDWSTVMLAFRLKSQLIVPNKTHEVWNYEIFKLKI